jgi:hypothetical protein
MSPTRPENDAVHPIQLRPRVSVPLASMAAAVFFSFLVGRLIGLGLAWEPWWTAPITVLLFCAAVTSLWSGAVALGSRSMWTMMVAREGFAVGDTIVAREQVVAIASWVERHFKGVRIDLADGSALGVPAHVQLPRKVLAAFRRMGYPVSTDPGSRTGR